MHDAITKLLRPDFGVPSHLTTGQGGLTPAQAYGVEIEPSPALAAINARKVALDEVVKASQVGSAGLVDLVLGVEPDKLSEAVKQVAEGYAIKQFVQTQSANAFQALMGQRAELMRTEEPWNWQRKQLNAQVQKSVKRLKEAAGVLGETLLSTDANAPHEVSVEAVGNANKSIRELASLGRHLPKLDSQKLLDSAELASVFAKPTGDFQPENPEEAQTEAVTIKALAHKSVGVLLAALAVNALPGYSLEVSENWDEVARRAATLNEAAKQESVSEPNVYISMGAGGTNVQGGNLPSLS